MVRLIFSFSHHHLERSVDGWRSIVSFSLAYFGESRVQISMKF